MGHPRTRRRVLALIRHHEKLLRELEEKADLDPKTLALRLKCAAELRRLIASTATR